MGKGDRKTRKGKIFLKSYGNVRPHSDEKAAAGPATTMSSAKPSTGKLTSAANKPAAKSAPVKSAAAAKKSAPAKKKV